MLLPWETTSREFKQKKTLTHEPTRYGANLLPHTPCPSIKSVKYMKIYTAVNCLRGANNAGSRNFSF